MFHYLTLNDIDVKGKLVGLRVDINSPIINKKVHLNERIIQSCVTIKELTSKGAKVVLMAHQSRKGKPDCVSLREHGKLLEKELKTKITFEDSFELKNLKSSFDKLKEGQILLLENLRFLDEELDISIKNNKITRCIKEFDYYVFDAFSVAHRAQSSVLGSPKTPLVSGRLMEKELKGLIDIEHKKTNQAFLFGGAKPDDLLDLIEVALEKNEVEEIFLTGVIGELALHLKGFYLGKKLEIIKELKWDTALSRLQRVLTKYPEKFILPKDVAFLHKGKRVELEVEKLQKNQELLDECIIEDIGSQTATFNGTMFPHYDSIYFKGPQGNFEKKGMEKGTKLMLKELTSSGAFTFLGGGHSVTSAKDFGFLSKFSYASLAGGALVSYLSGKELPGICAMHESYLTYTSNKMQFVVVGSNVVDTGISVPENLTKSLLGSKIKVDEDFKTTVGGGGVNVSICLSRLKAHTGYLGKFSYESEKRVREELERNNVSIIKNKTSKKQASKSVILDTKDGDRVILSYRGQNQDLTIDDCLHVEKNIPNFYFTSLTGNSFLTLFSLARKIKKENEQSKICYNPSSYLIKTEQKRITHLIKTYIDLLVLNIEEAKALTGKDTITDCLKALYKLNTEIVVITCGNQGAYVYDGKEEHYQKAKSTKVVDTTGAGDCFASTFFYFYTRNVGIKKALRYAAINSASCIAQKGAVDGLLHLDDLLKK